MSSQVVALVVYVDVSSGRTTDDRSNGVSMWLVSCDDVMEVMEKVIERRGQELMAAKPTCQPVTRP